jgi:N-acetyl-anhydromuramyl-L-alanine amidase AmpD
VAEKEKEIFSGKTFFLKKTGSGNSRHVQIRKEEHINTIVECPRDAG